MNPNASDIVLVNSLIEIAAKGSALQKLQMKGFTHICFFSIQLSTYTSVLQPNPCLTNKTVSQVNSTNTTDNTDNGWCDYKSVSRSHVTKKIQFCLTEPIEHSQQYRCCNWPELEHKSFDYISPSAWIKYVTDIQQSRENYSMKKKDGIENEELTIFSIWRKSAKRWPWRTESPVLYIFGF